MTREIRKANRKHDGRQMTNNKEEGEGGADGRREERYREGEHRGQKPHRRVERRARRRKLGQEREAHFLFILLLSERPSLEVASSEHDSLPFFGRAAGIEARRMRGRV